MPRTIDYPRAPLARALTLAEAVDRLGGEATIESAADALSNKVGGAFRALLGAAGKFGAISLNRGKLKVEQPYHDYKLAYTDEQRQEALRTMFLNAPLFAAVTKRLEGQPIPPHFEKLLIREYTVPEEIASRITGYYIEGAKMAGLIGPNGNINSNTAASGPTNTTITPVTGSLNITEEGDTVVATASTAKQQDCMTVRILGLGMDEKINIEAEEDLDILEAMVKKMRRLLKSKEATGLAG